MNKTWERTDPPPMQSRAALLILAKTPVAGTEIPFLSSEHILKALRGLSNQDAILGPATDGGYYLIGLSTKASFLFEGIDWGTDRVFKQTTHLLDRYGLSWQSPEELYDIDEGGDLQKFGAWLRINPYSFQSASELQLKELVLKLVNSYELGLH